MGFSLSWNATRGIGADAALALQGLAATGVDANYLESPVSAVSLEGGWLLVVASGCDHRITSASILAKLSVGCEVVGCTIEEHVMFSSSELWSYGSRIWRVEHDAQLAFDHLIATGSPPGTTSPRPEHTSPLSKKLRVVPRQKSISTLRYLLSLLNRGWASNMMRPAPKALTAGSMSSAISALITSPTGHGGSFGDHT